MTTDYRQIAEVALTRVASEFRHLKSEIDGSSNEYIDFALNLYKQPGLVFDVYASLQGDELCLAVGESFLCEFFPCSDPRVVERFDEALRGVLSGEVRLVEQTRSGRTFKAELQKQVDGRWTTVAAWSRLLWPSLARKEIRILRNGAE